MSTFASTTRARAPRGNAAVEIALAGILAVAAVASAFGTARLGIDVLVVALFIAAVGAVVIAPHRFCLVLLAAAIVIEPGAIDFTGDLAPVLYEFPGGMQPPITTTPLELGIFAAAISILIRGSWRESGVRMPWLAAGVVGALLFGFAFGWQRGGAMNIAYNEARGLIGAILVFFIAATAPPSYGAKLAKCLFVSTGALAMIVLWRYFVYVRPGDLTVPIEFAFAHEDSIILGVGLVMGLTALARSRLSAGQRIALVVYCVLVSLALFATQRRAATLVGIVGAATVAGMVFPRRPVLVTALAVPAIICAGVYLGANWNREYGTTAQPARAIRSQIDPSPRDEASDAYRDLERANVLATLRLNEVFGVGFGMPFAQFEPMVNLESFWPLQNYTPHQNVLWLWLKLGFFGLATFLAFIAVAIARCLRVVRGSRAVNDETAAAIVTAATLLMYLSFATVDIAFVSARETLLLGIALAVALSLPDRREHAEMVR